MLTTLSVSNFAIIDNITIDFDNHLSVLTGETGAGKSLIIDAIGLLLGDRASSSLVRLGTSKAVIEGVFTGYNPVIEIDKEHANEQILDILAHIEDYQALVDKNRETALRMGDWTLRMREVVGWLQDKKPF